MGHTTKGWLRTRAKVLWDFRFQTGRQLLANQPHVVVIDKQQKEAVIVDDAIPADSNNRKKEQEKIEKGLKEKLEEMWKVKTYVIPLVIGATGAVDSRINI